ncbi:hypothetical protein KY290_030864 [Solanum tuberosum]|uniref:Non-LTR retroelement reverse transcriptase n=1 Tax=Solanum tuberosum TaxID=4113 RepID=A0ABQ7U7I0_SOLTU|nr:hypothetical protein KY290_030864 [Solanum tuberosum]
MKFTYNNKCCIISSVYARCNALDRLELWEELESIDEKDHYPWVVGGDFNVIVNEEEKLGGLPFTQNEAMNFALFISNCALTEVRFSGSKYTWWNGRIEEECIFKRLDRVLVNQDFMNLFPSSEDIVTQNWKIDFAGSPFVVFQAKIKKVKKALARWSREVFGNVFQRISTIEDVIKVKESQLEIQPIANNRAELNKLEAELKNFFKHEEEFWKQKARMKWFKEGDANTKFFHSYVTGRRKKLHIAETVTEQGITVQSNEQIGKASVDFFAAQFTEDNDNSDYNMLDYIPRSISNAENEDMIRPPEKEEVKKVMFELDGNNAVDQMISQDCSSRLELPKYITHTNLVLLPKKEVVKHFSDLRPIGLSSFMNKIISRLVHGRILNVLPRIISQNQAEVLARGLNNLNRDTLFKGYGLPKWSPEINHLSYADDTILFCSGG